MEYPEHLLQQLQAHPPSTADGLMAQLLLHPWPLYWYEQVRASDTRHQWWRWNGSETHFWHR